MKANVAVVTSSENTHIHTIFLQTNLPARVTAKTNLKEEKFLFRSYLLVHPEGGLICSFKLKVSLGLNLMTSRNINQRSVFSWSCPFKLVFTLESEAFRKEREFKQMTRRDKNMQSATWKIKETLQKSHHLQKCHSKRNIENFKFLYHLVLFH